MSRPYVLAEWQVCSMLCSAHPLCLVLVSPSTLLTCVPFLEVSGFASGAYPLSSCHGVTASLHGHARQLPAFLSCPATPHTYASQLPTSFTYLNILDSLQLCGQQSTTSIAQHTRLAEPQIIDSWLPLAIKSALIRLPPHACYVQFEALLHQPPSLQLLGVEQDSLVQCILGFQQVPLASYSIFVFQRGDNLRGVISKALAGPVPSVQEISGFIQAHLILHVASFALASPHGPGVRMHPRLT